MLSLDQDKYLCANYLNLYRDPKPMWGFEVGPGWFDLINDVSAKLEALILTEPEGQRENYRASQVKSKFGGLRLYMSSSTPEMDAAIAIAEGLSYETCEECGAPGTSKGSIGWVWTFCQRCRSAYNASRGI